MNGGIMAATEADELPVDPARWCTAELGEALAGWRMRAATSECRWLAMLAEFERREGWRLDGQLPAVDWLGGGAG
jgi:hypothetical protein